MRVLVCGGRDYGNRTLVYATLAKLEAEARRDASHVVVIHGGAWGADALASEWAFSTGREAIEVLPDWRTHGRRAGPIRNQKMLDEQHPDIVVAFKGERGTADMVRRALAAGVTVMRPDEAPPR